MEGPAEVNEAMEHSVESPHIKRKENDEQLPQQSGIPAALENAAQIITPGSPDDFMEHLAGKSESFDQSSASEQGMMVEELTFSNYKDAGLFRSGEELALGNHKSPGLFRTEEVAGKKGLWNNLTRMSDGPRDSLSVGDRAHADSSFMQPYSMKRPVGSPHMEPNYSKVAEHLARSDSRIASRSMLDKPSDEIRTKVLPASGFARYLVKSSLRGKGVVYKHEGINNQNQRSVVRSNNDSKGMALVGGGSEVLDRHSRKADDKVLIGGGSPALKAQNDEVSLRDWLMPRHHNMDKVERLQMFKQILKIVDTSHSQGLGLQHLRPSFFLISPSRQVRYIGSFIPKSRMEQLSFSNDQDINYYPEQHLKRKRYPETKYQTNKSYMMPGYGVPTSGCLPSASEFLDLEKKWYASPEELNNNVLFCSSNIYSLGVLLFELFCYFETRELRSVAMSDLRYRILPPSFLSESSKEAGFSLWLLHPEPSSRPNSRDILQSDFISESQDLFSDQSSASIDEEDAEADLLSHFLLNMKEEKEKQAAKLVADVGCLTTDIQEVERRYPLKTVSPDATGLPVYSNEASIKCTRVGPMHMVGMSASTANEERLMRNLDQLEKAYFSMRSKVGLSESNSTARPDSDVLKIRDTCSQMQNSSDECSEPTDPLGSFFEGLCKYARHSKFEVCGSLRSVDILNSANVICSLSFDRDEDYFAAAGVSKKIKIFEFGALLNDNVDIHYPLIEMSSKSKLSCICWNNYIKNYLASTDYEGVVQLWDASTGQGFTQYTEHQKRAWSVDFSVVDPTKLASGSDDCSVKIWSIKERNCIDTIRNVANVCCVQFSPHSSQMLAFGSADYRIYCYDLRYTRAPWCTLAGHGKAVSYVKFIDSVTAISASTDNSLKIWDLNKTTSGGLSTNACSSTLTGHSNEKNFVGLSVCDGYIACGSESNEVYAYYKALPMPITSHKFGSTDPITGHEIDDDNGQFVSSVCWRSKSNMVLAANSSGSIKLLQMV